VSNRSLRGEKAGVKRNDPVNTLRQNHLCDDSGKAGGEDYVFFEEVNCFRCNGVARFYEYARPGGAEISTPSRLSALLSQQGHRGRLHLSFACAVIRNSSFPCFRAPEGRPSERLGRGEKKKEGKGQAPWH